MPDYDVVISGAGLAGSACAIMYGRAGVRVALVERSTDPNRFKRACTHEIQASSVALLERLGLGDELRRISVPSRPVSFRTRYGWVRPVLDERYRYPHDNYNVRREKLDPLVRSVAAATPGVDLMLGRRAIRVTRAGGRIAGLVTSSRDGGERELAARLVVGAEGRESVVAASAGLPERRSSNGRFAFWGYFRGVELPFGSEAHVWFLDPDITYALPSDSGLTLLSTVLTKDRLPEYRAGAEELFRRVWSALPDGPPLATIRQKGSFVGRLDMTNHKRRPAGRGVALIGDAALAADPIWGWGCGWALASSNALVELTASPLRRGGTLDLPLRRYWLWHYAQFLGHHAFANSYSTGRKFSAVERALYKGAARDNDLAQRLHSFATASAGVGTFVGPRALVRALRAGVRRPPRRVPGPARAAAVHAGRR